MQLNHNGYHVTFVFQQVELTVVIDSSTSNYDASKGEQLALNADGSNKTNKDLDSILYPSGIMDKQVNTGSSLGLSGLVTS